MGLFNLFKKNDKKESVKKNSDIELVDNYNDIEQEKIVNNNGINLPICKVCGIAIQQHEKRKTFENKKYHIKCFRDVKKQSMKMVMSGQM